MRKSNLLLISWIMTVLYFLYVLVSLTKIGSQSNDAGGLIAFGILGILIFPHLILVSIGVLFNILGWALNKKGFALTAGILYTIAMVFMIPLFFYLIIQTVLTYVGYALMDTSNKSSTRFDSRSLDDYRSL